MHDPFRDAVSTFEELKKRFQAGDLSRQQFIEDMKKLRLKDAQGRYWMIGAQTGKWYYFDGRDWIASEPPELKGKGPVCVFCGHENKDAASVCGRCGGTLEGRTGTDPDKCPECGGLLEKPLLTCPRCDAKQADLKNVEIVKIGGPVVIQEGIYVLRAVKPVSLLRFMGALGGLAGAAYGVFAGATGSLAAAVASQLPAAIKDQQGKLMGAVIDGLGGGVAGFLALGLAGIVLACLINILLAMSGGLKIQLAAPATAMAPKETASSNRDNLGFNLLND
ncbi:MAG: zinc ribbon domain-containing protein [Acidobacteriota bacterium]|nr:zinc ribbon domain-containing protein [Acidobacteriota bacterium]